MDLNEMIMESSATPTRLTWTLEELDSLHAAATPGRWQACTPCTSRGHGCKIVWSPDGNATIFECGDGEDVPTTGGPPDAALTVALQNSYPALAAEIRALRAQSGVVAAARRLAEAVHGLAEAGSAEAADALAGLDMALADLDILEARQ